MAIVPYRENPNHVDADRPSTHGHDHLILGAGESDLWWWEPKKQDLERYRAAYEAKVARRIQLGFYKGTRPHDEGRPT